MAGLENYLATLKDNAGIAGGFNQGVRDRAALDTTLAGLTQKQAETQRYTGETPSYLRGREAAARTAELANVQGEADVTAGVPAAKAGQSMREAQLKAKQAEQALAQMPSQAKIQMMDQMQKEVESFNQLGLQLLQFSGSTGEAIQLMAEKYPDITKDPQFTSWAQKYGNMPREQALNAFKFEMQKYASGIATTREKFQTEALQEDQKQQGRMALGAQQGQFGVAEAQTRAAASGAGSKENTTMAIRRLAAIIADPNTSEQEKAAAEYELQAQLKFGSQTESSGIDPMFDVSKTKGLPQRPGQAPKAGDMPSLAKQAFGSYEPSKYDYRVNPSTGKLQRKPK